MSSRLLPPNATELEQAIADAMSRFGDIDVSVVADLYDAEKCPLHLLPYLAYAEQVDNWDSNWPESIQRATIINARKNRRIKGTRKAVEDAVASIGGVISTVEWWQTDPQGTPGTFDVIITGGSIYGDADLQAAMISAIDAVKPARAHYTLSIGVDVATTVGIVANLIPASYTRLTLQGNY